MTQRKIDVPIFPRNLVLGVHDRRNKDVLTDHILVVQELLTLVEEGGILSVGQKLVVETLMLLAFVTVDLDCGVYSGEHTIDLAIGKPSITFSNIAS